MLAAARGARACPWGSSCRGARRARARRVLVSCSLVLVALVVLRRVRTDGEAAAGRHRELSDGDEASVRTTSALPEMQASTPSPLGTPAVQLAAESQSPCAAARPAVVAAQASRSAGRCPETNEEASNTIVVPVSTSRPATPDAEAARTTAEGPGVHGPADRHCEVPRCTPCVVLQRAPVHSTTSGALCSFCPLHRRGGRAKADGSPQISCATHVEMLRAGAGRPTSRAGRGRPSPSTSPPRGARPRAWRRSARRAAAARRRSRPARAPASSASEDHTPSARPATVAAPSAVDSSERGRATGMRLCSACSSRRRSMAAAPPSARSADEWVGRRGGHGIGHVAHLERHALDAGPRQLGAADAAGEAGHDAARLGIPPRAAQAGERGDEGDAAAVGHRRRQRADLGGRRDDAEPVAQPLDGRARDEGRPSSA